MPPRLWTARFLAAISAVCVGAGPPRAPPPDVPYVASNTKGRAGSEEVRLWGRLSEASCPIDWAPVVAEQLRTWGDAGVRAAQLERYCRRKKVVRVSIVAGEVRFARWGEVGAGGNRFVCAFWLLRVASLLAEARGEPLPAVELVMQPTDGAQSTVPPEQRWPDPGPLFGSIKCGAEDGSVSFPMNIHDQFGAFGSGAMSLRSWLERNESLWGLAAPAWEQKARRLFFSSGSMPGKQDAAKRGHRAELFRLQSPLLNVTHASHSLAHYARHRYQVYAYGRCGWTRRLHELAFMHAVVFVEASGCAEFFLAAFEPWVHYVPVAEDFSDLPAQLARVDADPAAARAMADAWLARGRQVFSPECVLGYVDRLLREYATLQRDAPRRRPSWPVFDLQSPAAATPAFLNAEGAQLPAGACAAPPPKGRSRLTC